MPEEEFDEPECLRRIEGGEENAARELFRHFHPFVLKLVRAHLPRRLSEEDLTQMIFIKVFTNLPSFRRQMPLQHWISRVAVNTCLNELKAEKVRPEWRYADFSEETARGIEKLATNESETASTSESAAAKELLGQMLPQLSPEDRLLITMLHLEEKSVDEIRALTGWTRAAVKVRAFRARGKLKKMLSQLETSARR